MTDTNGNGKGIRRAKIRACPIHAKIMDQAVDELETHGYFNKEELLEDCGYSVVGDSIRWDYLREFIEEDHDVSLLPVVSRFFKTHVAGIDGKKIRTREERVVAPGKYLAGGNGRKTAGYCGAEIDNGVLAIKRLGNSASKIKGEVRSFDKQSAKVRKAVPGVKLPALEHKPDERPPPRKRRRK